ncbi:MAG: hypothetical protein K0Q66_1558 [Chitinophagaceae bacterium]|jgi:hypothetical protein|nr:hypothetical protein [Chitinophagaceae bacterium]
MVKLLLLAVIGFVVLDLYLLGKTDTMFAAVGAMLYLGIGGYSIIVTLITERKNLLEEEPLLGYILLAPCVLFIIVNIIGLITRTMAWFH